MAEEVTPEKFYAVILRSDGAFGTEEFDSAEDLAVRLKELINHDVSVACFKGSRLKISKPPLRYLMLDSGNIPLFETSPVIEPDETGYLGVDPAHLEDPPQINIPAAKNGVAPDEFFSDDDEGDVINIFDNALPDPDA